MPTGRRTPYGTAAALSTRDETDRGGGPGDSPTVTSLRLDTRFRPDVSRFSEYGSGRAAVLVDQPAEDIDPIRYLRADR